MMKFTVLLIVFALSLQTSECGVYGRSTSGNQGRSNSYVGQRNRYIGSNSQYDITTSTLPPTPKEVLAKKGLSMFGLISLMVLVIVLALAFYYGVMCYPFLCKKEKNYHFMDVSSTITAATSRSIQSIENFPCDNQSRDQKV